MAHVTILGLGNMGAALARTLMAAGWTVTVWNRSADKAAPLVAEGAAGAPDLAAAIAASDTIIACVKTHATTEAMLAPVKAALGGKTVVDLSTGGAEEATSLVALLTDAGAAWSIGMINAYPSGIGLAETAILCAGPPEVWQRIEPAIRALGGASAHVGETPAAVPALFAAMFTARQGFMFGLIYGGAVCRKAGLPVEAFAAQIPVTHGMAGNYGKLFARTVPDRNYDDAEATMAVYRAALDDVMATFEATGTSDAFPRLMRDLTKAAVEDGLQDKQLTALVERLL